MNGMTDRPHIFDPPREIRWIVFDAVGTLIRPDPPVAGAYFEAGRRHGSRIAAGEVHRRFHDSFGRFDRRELEGADPASPGALRTSEAHEAERWRTIVSHVFDDVPDRDALFADLFEHFARPAAWRYFDDVETALGELHRRGYRLGVASNFDRRLPLVLRGGPLEPLLEWTLASSQIGYRKPSRHFFAAVQRAAGAPAEAVLYVGDDPQGDVAAARAAGMPALQIDRDGSQSPAGCLSDLRELLELPFSA